MKITPKLKLTQLNFLIITLVCFSRNVASTSWAGSKYEIECTMCSACDNPCNAPATATASPPPPTPSPPPPSSSVIFPPPPSPPSSGGGNYYYSPPPPTYWNSPPTSTGPPGNYVRPPPPNPIVPYFPFYYHSPPLPSASVKLSGSIVVKLMTVVHILVSYNHYFL